jgi:ABC-2 type transport system ATP-binding protein
MRIEASQRAGTEGNARAEETGPKAPKPPVLLVRDVSVAIGGSSIVANASLAIGRGEIVTLLGPNGAGKSTLCRAITGQIAVASGEVRIRGRDPHRSRAAKSAIGMVPQQIALYDRLTPRENLVAFGAIMGVPRSEQTARSEALLERVGLSDRVDDPVRALSGGMQRRVNIAVALMHNPALIVLDEPTVGLDARSEAGIVDLLGSLRNDGTAILLVTHHLDEARKLGDRLVIMVAGRIRLAGALSDLITRHYAHLRQIRISNPRLPGNHRATAAMKALGLSPVESANTWTGMLNAADPALGELLEAVSSRRLEVDEIVVRQPDLGWLLDACICDAQENG